MSVISHAVGAAVLSSDAVRGLIARTALSLTVVDPDVAQVFAREVLDCVWDGSHLWLELVVDWKGGR